MEQVFRPVTVLLIDDESQSRAAFVKILETGVPAQVIAADSLAAVEQLQAATAVDCVIVVERVWLAAAGKDAGAAFQFLQAAHMPLLFLFSETDGQAAPAAGFFDSICRTEPEEVIQARVRNAVRVKRLWEEVARLREELQETIRELRRAQESGVEIGSQLEQSLRLLREMAIRDSLTKLYNHGYFLDMVEQEVSRAQRYTKHLSCLMIDIDYFKNINNQHGHLFGDQVLILLAELMLRCVRTSDYAARYGEEKFAVLLLESDYAEAARIAERIRITIEENQFRHGDISVQLTVSIGVASLLEEGILDRDRLLGYAEQSLTQAKLRGRNAVVVYKDAFGGTSAEAERLRDVEDCLYGTAEISKSSYIESVKMLVSIMEEKDSYTREHSINVLRYATLIGKQMNLPENELQLLGNAAILHDLGKIAIADAILLKNGRLTEAEYEDIKKHPVIAVRILRKNNYIRRELDLIL
ncbi:MAG: diguanylate cyclase, partial [Candidatus Omnitrophica bacterium]|nr:diguanylate cyclase [Candidatus Omnitrophota bacterium]